MRLKYYLRGVGIGIVVTTIIFMISISLHKNEIEPQNAAVENDKSTTVSEAEKNAKETEAAGTETEETDTGKTDLADTQTKDNADVDKPDAGESDAKKPDADKKDADKKDADKSDASKTDNSGEKEPSKDTAKDSEASGQKTSDTETKPKDKNTEKVRFEIKGGEFSDTICQKLKTAGLIDDAKAFNNFLVEKDYDNGILPGVYDIPKDATYEEIAALLTTKVE